VCPACHRTLICGEVLGAEAEGAENAWMMVAAKLIESVRVRPGGISAACHIGSSRLIQQFREM
jgi:hypothetical protein